MSTVMQIPVEPLTEAGFAPFGELLAPRETPPDFHGLMSVGWRADFQVTGEIRIMTLSSQHSGMQFTMLERHFDVSQTFIPLGSELSLVAVAEPTGNTPPAPESVRGFILDGTAGYVLKRGTWHSLDRYPLNQNPADIVIITGRQTQEDLESNEAGQFQFTEQVDFGERFGVTFEFNIQTLDGE